ncbi:MAG TPA: hypothetical protein VEV17_01500 [Bryobacteraceae bacterium]|nr:hypothetical protein [Bryobacteraceae bacterium]
MSAAEPITQRELSRDGNGGSIARRLAGPAILLALVIGFFWKLVLTDQYSWIEAPDIANQVVPWLDYEAQQFHARRFPMWDPYLFGGQSLIGQGQPGLAYPLNWILFSLPLGNGHLTTTELHWYFLSIHYLGALFCYWLCRDLGRSLAASILGGVAFGLGGYVGDTVWPQMINGAIWGPLVLLFLFRAARGVRPVASAAFSGLFLGVSWLSGHHQIPIFLTLAAAGIWLYFLLEKGRLNRALLKPAAVFVVFFVLAGALQTWPAFEYGRQAMRWVGSAHDPIAWNEPVPYTVHQQYSIPPIYLLGLVIPGYETTSSAFAGVVGLALAALALACWWRIREVRFVCGIGVAGLFLAIAQNDVFHGMLYSIVPLVEKARSPGTAIYLFHFAIAVLAAFGLDAMLAPENRVLLRRLAALLLGTGALVFLIIAGIDLAHALNWTFDDRVVMFPLAALLLAALAYRFSRTRSSRGWLPALVIGLYMLEAGNVAFYFLAANDDKDRSRYRTAFDSTKEVAAFLKSQPRPLRVDIGRQEVEFNFGDWYGIDAMKGVLPSLPANLCNIGFGYQRTLNLYGTNYAVANKPTLDGEQEIFRDSAGLIVYKNPHALPRVWTVHEAVLAKDPQDAFRLTQDSAFDLQKKTFGFTPAPSMQQCEGDSVRSFERGINSSTVVVDMKCRGMVVQSENDAPGWIATVDGRSTPIYAAYTTLRGVVVGPGTHKIEMRYHPLSVLGGAAATFSAFLGAFFLSIAPRRRRG